MNGRNRANAAVAFLAVAVAMAATPAFAVSAGSSADRQRIAIVGTIDIASHNGRFTIAPVSFGELIESDTGTFTGSGSSKLTLLPNGAQVSVLTGVERYKGKLGTFEVAKKWRRATVANGYAADTGEWTIRRGTGAYKGISGGGLLSGLAFPFKQGNVSILFRLEGYVSKR